MSIYRIHHCSGILIYEIVALFPENCFVFFVSCSLTLCIIETTYRVLELRFM